MALIFFAFMFAVVFIPCEVCADGILVGGAGFSVFVSHEVCAFGGAEVGCEVVFVDDGVEGGSVSSYFVVSGIGESAIGGYGGECDE